jgi:hypothetical protein
MVASRDRSLDSTLSLNEVDGMMLLSESSEIAFLPTSTRTEPVAASAAKAAELSPTDEKAVKTQMLKK